MIRGIVVTIAGSTKSMCDLSSTVDFERNLSMQSQADTCIIRNFIGSGARRSPVSAFVGSCKMHKAFHLKAGSTNFHKGSNCHCYRTTPRDLHDFHVHGHRL